jgi:hypothetical protein
MNQVMSKFGFKMSVNQFCEIGHIFQTVHWIELKFYRETWHTHTHTHTHIYIYCGKFSGQINGVWGHNISAGQS